MKQPLSTPYSLERYLQRGRYIDFDDSGIQEYLSGLWSRTRGEIELAREAFEYVRDSVAHSGDTGSARVTRTASEVMRYGEGICYAKSHLHPTVIATLESHDDCSVMYGTGALPADLSL
jgi:transglutaminase-like putative cysteine protease